VAAADSATRTDPSVDEATSSAPRRARRAAGTKAADGKAAASRARAAAAPKPGAKAATPSTKAGSDDEPAELDGDI
jgi:RNA polymerase primary sigma factor